MNDGTGLALSERTMYTDQQRGVDAGTKCSLGGSVEDQGRFCISFELGGLFSGKPA